MKTIFNKFLVLSGLGLLMLSACKKDGALVTSNGGKAGTLTASTTTPTLDKTKLSDTTSIVRFNFTAPNFGYSAAVTNTLQIDAPGDNWKNPATAVLPYNAYSQGYSTAVFNNLVLKLNLPAGVASQVQVRVAHSLSTAVPPVYSNVVSLTVTPFNLTSWLYVAGAYEGWANPGPQEDSLISVTGNGIYTGIINFTAGNNQFLVLPAKNWNHKYATTDATGSTSSTVKYDGPNNFYAPAAAGQYIVTINTNANTISFTLADYYSIIGSATPGGNWSTDMFLKFINDGNNTWVGSFTLLGGQFKFRQDGAWSNSWGDVSPADGKTVTDSSGGNINATAGAHTVTFTMAPTAFGTNPPVTTSYSLK
ncbi:MAG TPA: SusE domain-containing protein [Mucilaginibacter sp.]|jgi:hypothetical protein|nr:SusE domain-containing protein [Mucilaginibacter sp.]